MESYSISAATDKIPDKSTIGSFGFGKTDFLKLLVAQMKNQNPLSPKDGSDFMSQLAQLTSVELLQQVSDGLSTLAGVQSLAQASGLIGMEVETQPDSAGKTVRGIVSEVSMDKGVPTLLVDGKHIAFGDVAKVRAK